MVSFCAFTPHLCKIPPIYVANKNINFFCCEICVWLAQVSVCVSYWTYMCDEHRIEMRRMLRLLTNIISYIQFTSYSIRIWFWKVARRSIHINHFNIVLSTFETLSFYFEHFIRQNFGNYTYNFRQSINAIWIVIIHSICQCPLSLFIWQ